MTEENEGTISRRDIAKFPDVFQGNAVEVDRYKVEVRENSKGEIQVSTRATHDDPHDAVKIALDMFFRARATLDGDDVE